MIVGELSQECGIVMRQATAHAGL